jgi:hypothetical protein
MCYLILKLDFSFYVHDLSVHCKLGLKNIYGDVGSLSMDKDLPFNKYLASHT